MRRGLVFGKFMPLHRGHQLLIEAALAECDKVTILVYDSPVGDDTLERMPVAKRLGWIADLYPQAEQIVSVADPWFDKPGHDGPEYAERYAREFWVEHGGGTFADHLELAQTQLRREHAAAGHARDFLFCDTNAWTTLHWSLFVYGTADVRLWRLAEATMD